MRRRAYRLWLHARVVWCEVRFAWHGLRVVLARRRVAACRRRVAAAELARDGRWAGRVLEASQVVAMAPDAHRVDRPDSVDLVRVRAWLDQNTAAVVDMTGPVGDGEIDNRIYEHAVNAVERCNAYEPGDNPTQAVLAGFIAVGAAAVLEARLVRVQDGEGSDS